jgi:hypothetical protein
MEHCSVVLVICNWVCRRKPMRKYVLAMAVAASVAAPVAAFAQQLVIEPPRRHAPARGIDENAYGSARCDELRKACLHKRELGEEGRGNCRWYRENCR